MESGNKGRTRAGRWERQPGPEPYSCFFPSPLPPDPPLELAGPLLLAHDRASRALARLDGLTALLPNPRLLLYAYVRKEAVLSSQIEGTQSSLSDLLLYENRRAPGVPLSDVREVSNYVAALEHGLARLDSGFPLSLRLIREVHAVLLRGTRGADRRPGEFRSTQNWIGGTRPGNAVYVPPPPHEVVPALGALEKFMHGEPGQTPPLLKSGLVHAQFESIHPFLDGNGRAGRLLIPLLLHAEGALKYPLLYLSLHFKRRRLDYYDALMAVRRRGAWEEWLAFYLAGVEEVSRECAETVEAAVRTFRKDSLKLQALGRAADSALRVHGLLEKHCLLTPAFACRASGLSLPTVLAALRRLSALGITREVTGQRRRQAFAYRAYWELLSKGMGSPD